MGIFGFGKRKEHFSKLRDVLTNMKNDGYKSVIRKVDDTHPHIKKIQRAFKNKNGKGFSFFGTDPDELKSRFIGNKNYLKTASMKKDTLVKIALVGIGKFQKALVNRIDANKNIAHPMRQRIMNIKTLVQSKKIDKYIKNSK